MEEKKTEKKIDKKKIYKVLFVVFAIGFVISLGVIFFDMYDRWQEQKRLESLAGNDTETEYVEETEEDLYTKLGIEIPEKNLDWNLLNETNPDIYAWIYIPNTVIDYPVLQHPTDDAFYLRRDIDGNKSTAGCIFSEHTYNSRNFDDFNTVLYGHNMKAKTMFQNLHFYEDATFFEENRYVYIYTSERVFVYEIFAAYEFSDKHVLANYSTVSEAGKQRYLDEVFSIRDMKAQFRDDVDVTVENHLLTLSTCVDGKPNNRYLVQGILIEE
mgnify:CR=1 FL=1